MISPVVVYDDGAYLTEVKVDPIILEGKELHDKLEDPGNFLAADVRALLESIEGQYK